MHLKAARLLGKPIWLGHLTFFPAVRSPAALKGMMTVLAQGGTK
jgi:hypothetical protein